jgi:zinc transporter
LGINVGGIPGTDYGFGFWVTCALLFLVLLGELYLFRRMKWI